MNLEELIEKYEEDRSDMIACDVLSMENAIEAINNGATEVHISRYTDQICEYDNILKYLYKILKVKIICKDYTKCGIGNIDSIFYILDELED